MARSKHLKPLAFMLCLLTLFPNLVFSQDESGTEHIWGDTYSLPKKQTRIAQLRTKAGEIVTVGHQQNTSICLEKLDHNLHFKKEVIIPLNEMPDDYDCETVLQIADKLWWFYSTRDKREEKETLYAQELDIEEGKLAGQEIKLKETGLLIPYPIPVDIYKTDFTGKWQFALSPDGSKLLVQSLRLGWEGERENKKERLETAVFDKALKTISSQTFSLPYVEAKINYDDFQVDNEGNVYTLSQLYTENKVRNKLRPFRYELLKWTNGSGEAIKISLPLQNKFVTDAILQYVPGKGYIVGGFYGLTRTSAFPAGTFLFQLDAASNQLIDLYKGTYAFAPATTQKFIFTRKNSRKSAPGIGIEATQTLVKEISANNDGSIHIYGEDRFEEQWGTGHVGNISGADVNAEFKRSGITLSQRRAPDPSYQHNFSNIIAVNMDKDKLAWTHIIAKIQRGTEDPGRLSFRHFRSGSSDYIFYIDNPKNLDLKDDDYPALHLEGAAGTLIEAKIDGNGALTKKALFAIRDEGRSFPVTGLTAMPDGKTILIKGDERRGDIQNGYLILPE
jgi:hypothetical protein